MLLAIKHYLSVKKTAHLKELSLHFNQPPDVMRLMLQHWIRKGQIQAGPKPAGCGVQCHACKPEIAEVYEWLKT